MGNRLLSRGAVAVAITVAVLGLTAGAASAHPRAHAAAAKTFTLPTGSAEWLATGITLSAGQSLEIKVSGNGTCHVGPSEDCHEGAAAGAGSTCAGRPLGELPPGPGGDAMPYGAVVGRVGSGAPFLIGLGAKATGTGELQIVYNDCAGYYGDNGGNYTVSIALPANHLTITYSPTASSGSGTSIVETTITDLNEKNEPVAGATIHIAPPIIYGEGQPSALICDESNRLVYPYRLTSVGSLLGKSFERITDSKGQIHFSVLVGTTPGEWLLEALEEGSPGTERTYAALNIAAGGTAPVLPAELAGYLLAAGGGSSGNFTSPTQQGILTWLGAVAAPSGALGAVAYAPIYGTGPKGEQTAGILLYAPGARQQVMSYLEGKGPAPSIAQAVVIDVPNAAKVLITGALAGKKLVPVPYRLPGLAEWASGGAITITDPSVQALDHATTIPFPARGTPHFGLIAPAGNEDLLYGYGPYPQLGAGPTVEAAFNKCIGYTFATTVTPHSPVVVTAVSGSRKAGLSAKGRAIDTLPGAVVNHHGSKLVSLELPKGSYKLQVTGTGSGPATLVISVPGPSGPSFRVFSFRSRRGATGTISVSSRAASGSMVFAGHRVTASDGLKIKVHGLPKRLGTKPASLALTLADQFGHPVSGVTVTASGTPLAAPVTTALHQASKLALTLSPTKKGTIHIALSGLGYAPESFALKVR